MAGRPLRTRDIARALGVHVNTVRLYEATGYIAPVPRDANGYRRYAEAHLEQARLAQLALGWPLVGDAALLRELVARAAAGDLGAAMELAYRHLAQVRVERTRAEAAAEFLERWAAGQLLDAPRAPLTVAGAARQLGVSADVLRSWERSGLVAPPRDPANRYRRYGAAELARLRVVRTLSQAGFSHMAILGMLRRADSGDTADLRGALDVPPEEASAAVAADRRLTTLAEVERRAQAVIRQVGRLAELARPG